MHWGYKKKYTDFTLKELLAKATAKTQCGTRCEQIRTGSYGGTGTAPTMLGSQPTLPGWGDIWVEFKRHVVVNQNRKENCRKKEHEWPLPVLVLTRAGQCLPGIYHNEHTFGIPPNSSFHSVLGIPSCSVWLPQRLWALGGRAMFTSPQQLV